MGRRRPILDGWWAWSGEADLGFWGAMRTATVNVVDDPACGPYAYGADMTAVGKATRILLRDGVRRRLRMFTRGGFGFEITGARYSRADIGHDLGTLELVLERPADLASTPVIKFSRLPAGRYTVTLDGIAMDRQLVSDGALATLVLPESTTDMTTVRTIGPSPE